MHTHTQIEAALQEHAASDLPPQVALAADGHVRGYVRPGIWELPEQSILRAFLSARNGVAHHLALPPPEAPDAQQVATALFSALSEGWRAYDTTGDLIRWPSTDPWFESALFAQGFQVDSICAAYTPPLNKRRQSAPSSFVTRPATPADETALVTLFEEELRAHESYTPFVRSNPTVLAAFRKKLTRLWAGKSLEDGAPLILVVEREGEIVAMAENTLLDLSPDDEPGFTPPGRYGCIDNVSVQKGWRRHGIGRWLVQAVFDAFAATGLALDGYLLWYNPDNPLAGTFWPRMGFLPLWTTYQRLHPA